MDSKKLFPRGIELVNGAIIENNKGEILLTTGPKWKNKWGMPGGHVEVGEKLLDSIVREGEEETGLKLKAIAIVHWGELIGTQDFHRAAHFVFFDAYCKVIGGELKLQKEEISESKWMMPEEALKENLAEGYSETIRDFIKYKKSH